MTPRIALALALVLGAAPAVARDRLGVWGDWGAFVDAAVPRCYAIAMPQDEGQRGRETQGYATVATWPRRAIHGEVHVRLSRSPAPGRPVNLRIGQQSFALAAAGLDAWAADRRMDAAVIAAMRSGETMTISARGRDGRLLHETYRLAGAASAMDAASLGCGGR